MAGDAAIGRKIELVAPGPPAIGRGQRGERVGRAAEDDIRADLKHAVAYYDHSRGDDADEEIAEAFLEATPRLRRAVGAQARIKRTPELRFELDGVLRGAQHIEEVLRTLPDLEPGAPTVELDPDVYRDPDDVR